MVVVYMWKVNVKNYIKIDFIKYIVIAILSFIIDISLFTIFNHFLYNIFSYEVILISTVLSRVISSLFNYFGNLPFKFICCFNCLTTVLILFGVYSYKHE